MSPRRIKRVAQAASAPLLPSTTASIGTFIALNASVAPQITQPTAFLPLTTTFTPPSSCQENRLTMLPPPGYFIWANEPVPFSNQTSSACHPPEFMKGYRSISSGNLGSSVVPAMSPFVCPANHCTMMTAADDYVACCPSYVYPSSSDESRH